MAKLESLIGQVLDGKYHLDRLLGQGGMGAVFLATHLGTTRPVALKVIAPQFMTNEEVGERFRREAEAAGRLRHPNVVNVTDFGVATVGRDTLAYLVMEYLDGCSLGDMIKQRGALPLPFVVDTVEQICLAIGNAHQQGIIHRDLKPDNIYLQPNQRGAYIVKVLDFGLAKLRDTSDAEDTTDASGFVPTVATKTIAGRGANTVAAAHTTQGQGAEETRVGAATAVQADTAGGSEAATMIQPLAEVEAATLIQPLPLAGEEQTRIFEAPDVQEEVQEVQEDVTRIFEKAEMPEDETATRIFDPGANEEAATQIQLVATTGVNTGVNNPQGESAQASEASAPSLTNSDRSATRKSGNHSSALRSATGSTTADTSRSLSVTSSSSVELTRVGSILGTPLYMSPEQCRGEALDPRSDIYSLGVIVYQMLAGETPFAGGMTELMTKHCDDEPPPLKERRDNIPVSVARLVMSALAKNPAERPATAESFANALRATAETEDGLLQQAKAFYYSSQRAFFLLSLGIYGPFALLSLVLSLTLDRLLSTSSAAATAFYVFIFALILFAVRLNVAGCALLINELRLSRSPEVKVKTLLKTVLARLPALFTSQVLALVKAVGAAFRLRSPVKAYIGFALFPATVTLEGLRGGGALRRSEELVGPLRSVIKAVLARDFGISLISIIGFPSITMIMAVVFGASRTDMLGSLMLKAIRTFTVEYCWFILFIMHTVYSAVPLAMSYFKARQAGGETLEEKTADLWRQSDPRKRPDRMGKATVGWFVTPFVLLAGLLLSAFVGTGDSSGESLFEATQEGRHAVVKRLLAEGRNPNETRIGNRTPLMEAARDGRTAILKDLIAAGANLDTRDGAGTTALISAANANRIEAVRALLEAGADKNAQNNKGQTALILAASRGRDEAVRALLNFGADTSVKDHAGKTALMYAEQESHAEIVRVLKEAGAKE